MAQDDPFGTARPHNRPGHNLEPLAAQVISVLHERQSTSTVGIRRTVLDYLVRAVTSRNAFDPALVLEELRGFRLPVDTIIDVYIPKVAARMGALWTSSDIDFAAVTVGALRLQSLLSEATNTHALAAYQRAEMPLALIVVPEGEQHFLGALVVSAQLRRLGCEVDLSISEPPKQIVDRVIHDKPDMILFSIARTSSLETAAQTAKKIKTKLASAPVLALGGACCAHSDLIKDMTGVDLVTNTAKDVMVFYTKRHKALGSE